jgi:MoxR-like ATPase
VSNVDIIMKGEEIIRLQELVRRVPASDHVISYAVKLARATRHSQDNPALDYIKNWVTWGAGPRASQYLILGAKTRAILYGRPTPSVDDVKAVARPVLRHRIVTSFTAEAEGMTAMDIVDRLLKDVAE